MNKMNKLAQKQRSIQKLGSFFDYNRYQNFNLSTQYKILSMQKTISSSCYDAIIIKQQNRSYRSTAFQVVFSSNLIKLVQKNRLKNLPPYKLSLFVNDVQVELPMKMDDSGRVVFQKEYMRKMSMVSDSSDVSDDQYSQKSSTRDSRFSKPAINKAQKFQDLKNQQIPKNFWQFAWLFRQKKETDSHMQSRRQQPELDQIKLSKIKQQAYEGEQNSKEPLFHLSLCGNLLKKKQVKEQILKTFYQNRVQYKDFIKDPPTYLNDSNLVVKIDDSIYTWQLGIAILTCRFAYGKQLSKQLIEDIIKNKFTKSKLFTFFSRQSITKLELNEKTSHDLSKEQLKGSDPGFRKIERSGMLVRKYRKTPDTQMIKKMKLKYGKNQAKFVLDVGSGIKGEISMKIFLWDHSQKFVISDIDGTITKSDILGQILSKWIHPGVTKLFTQVCKRQYKIIYLTARAIGQYQQTCKFLQTVQEDGVFLPEGPLLMSPDGYMRSLTREIIYKTPDYLKTKILANINELFPNSKKPIYCGFGNRATDSAAYLRINIAADRIFQISEKSTITRQSDKEFTTTYLQILENISQFFPEYLKETQNMDDSDQQVEEFEAVGLDDVQISKTKSVEDILDRDYLDGFDQEEIMDIGLVSKSRKSEHQISQEDIKGIEQFLNTENQKVEQIDPIKAEQIDLQKRKERQVAYIVEQALKQKIQEEQEKANHSNTEKQQSIIPQQLKEKLKQKSHQSPQSKSSKSQSKNNSSSKNKDLQTSPKS